MKKILFLTIGLLFLGIANPALATSGTNDIFPYTVEVGEYFYLAIFLTAPGNQICRVQADITFPQDLAQFDTLYPASSQTVIESKSVSNGTLHFVGSSSECKMAYEDGGIFAVIFKALKTGSCQMHINPVNFSWRDQTSGETIQSTASISDPTAINITPYVEYTPYPEYTPDANYNPYPTYTPYHYPRPTSFPIQTPKKAASPKPSAVPTMIKGVPVEKGIDPPILSNVEFAPDVNQNKKDKKCLGIILKGQSPPNSKVYITINSQPINVIADADNNGDWKYTLKEWLSDGVHKFTAYSEKDGVKSPSVENQFIFSSVDTNHISIGNEFPLSITMDTRKIEIYGLIGFVALMIIISIVTFFILKKIARRKVAQAPPQVNPNQSISHLFKDSLPGPLPPRNPPSLPNPSPSPNQSNSLNPNTPNPSTPNQGQNPTPLTNNQTINLNNQQ